MSGMLGPWRKIGWSLFVAACGTGVRSGTGAWPGSPDATLYDR